MKYALAALVLFAVEACIAIFASGFVRGYIGDVLAVALVYAALRAVTPLAMIPALAVTLTIALAIEIAQALNLFGAAGLHDNQLARIVLGGAFDWFDLAAYAVGAVLIAIVEIFVVRRRGA
jgi:hypothetical protein